MQGGVSYQLDEVQNLQGVAGSYLYFRKMEIQKNGGKVTIAKGGSKLMSLMRSITLDS